MEISVSEEFRKICSEILSEKKKVEEWVEIESDDMFQTRSFSGGFDATEMAFCFSYYNEDAEEYWFQLTLDEIGDVYRGKKSKISIRPAE